VYKAHFAPYLFTKGPNRIAFKRPKKSLCPGSLQFNSTQVVAVQVAFWWPIFVGHNRCLKEMAKEIGVDVLLFTHSARYFFANEVLYNNGVELKTVARIMGQDSVKSAEIYVRANRTAISESMQTVLERTHNPDGSLQGKKTANLPAAKVVVMRAI
jgi:hypothetical protein